MEVLRACYVPSVSPLIRIVRGGMVTPTINKYLYNMMKRTITIVAVCIAILMLFAFAKGGHINLPGHGNRENQNLKEAVLGHVSSTLSNGETVEFDSKYLCEDFMDNGEARFSANVIYYVISLDGTKEQHIAHVICNEDKDRIIEWQDIDNPK